MPQNFIPLNIQRLLAAQEEKIEKSGTAVPPPGNAVTDWVADQSCQAVDFPAGVISDYRVDINRTSGNQVFRRYANGVLDVDAARDRVLEVLEKARNGVVPLTDMEKIILSVYFPTVFDFMDPSVAAKMRIAQFNLSLQEVELVATKVAIALNQQLAANVSQTGVSS